MTVPVSAPRLRGSLTNSNGIGGIRMDDVYDTEVDDLWSALTEPERLARWLAEVSGDLRLGGQVVASFVSGGSGPGRIEACEPGRRLLVSLQLGDEPSEVEATLSPEGAKTRLVIEMRGLPVEDRPYHAAGWHAHLEDLEAHLAGRGPSDWPARWSALKAPYLELAEELPASQA